MGKRLGVWFDKHPLENCERKKCIEKLKKKQHSVLHYNDRSLTFSKISLNSSLNGKIRANVRKLSCISSHKKLSVSFCDSFDFLLL